MHGFWPIFFLAVILKIPVGLLLYMVWWAVKRRDAETEEAPPESGDHDFRRFRRQPKHPAARAAAATGPMRCRSPTARPPGAPGCRPSRLPCACRAH